MIREVLDLARRYTAEEWRHAAYIAATQTMDDACMAMANLAETEARD